MKLGDLIRVCRNFTPRDIAAGRRRGWMLSDPVNVGRVNADGSLSGRTTRGIAVDNIRSWIRCR